MRSFTTNVTFIFLFIPLPLLTSSSINNTIALLITFMGKCGIILDSHPPGKSSLGCPCYIALVHPFLALPGHHPTLCSCYHLRGCLEMSSEPERGLCHSHFWGFSYIRKSKNFMRGIWKFNLLIRKKSMLLIHTKITLYICTTYEPLQDNITTLFIGDSVKPFLFPF